MQPLLSPFFFGVLLFLSMLTMLGVGRRLAARDPNWEADKASLATIEAAIFGLFGLLIAFTFSGASSRFQEKRMLIAEEANVIESAYMRIDLVASEAQPELRDLFRQYVDSRLEIYRRLPDMKAASFDIERSKKLQRQIWAHAISATRISPAGPASLLLPAVNDMIRMHRTRMISLQNHPPGFVYGLLLLLGLLCSLLAGFRTGTGPRRNWFYAVLFPLVTAAVVYVTIDIEYPRVGMIRLEHADQMLKDIRAKME